MQIAPKIYLEDKITNQHVELPGTHQFSQPMENPDEDSSEEIHKKSVNYCRHFGPFHKSTTINSEYVSFQLYGTISGVNCRKQISKFRQGETHKSRFGLYLCKDFIPFTTRSSLISNSDHQHYHLLLNSQNFELTADRNNISNEDNPKVKWVMEEARKLIEKEIIPLAESGYFRIRKEEDEAAEMIKRTQEVEKRKDEFSSQVDLDGDIINELSILKRPDEEAQVAILFTALIANNTTNGYIEEIKKIGHYSGKSSTDMICVDFKDENVLVEVEYRLSNLFKHKHPYETFDYIVCWTVDLDINEQKRIGDRTLKLIKDREKWMLKYGPMKTIPIIELSSVVEKINQQLKNK